MAHVVINAAEMRRLIASPSGPVFRVLRQKAALVEAEAKRRCPVDTGRLRSSITTEMSVVNRSPRARVGSPLDYAVFVEKGTGIYGPRHRPIRPRRAKFLSWIDRGTGKRVFAREVRGVRPRPYLVPALQAIFPGRVRVHD